VSSQVREVHWSDLARDPRKVAEIADEDGGVRVLRRDGAPLILTREDRVEQAEAGAVLAARAIRQLLLHRELGSFAQAILIEFPWVGVLPSADVKQFVQDFANAVLAAAELQRWQIVDETVSEWKATAAIHADPALRKRLTGPITDDLGPVPSPVDEADDGSDREPTG
jgi:hypothetical protein